MTGGMAADIEAAVNGGVDVVAGLEGEEDIESLFFLLFFLAVQGRAGWNPGGFVCSGTLCKGTRLA
jgi:hypothetical protein